MLLQSRLGLREGAEVLDFRFEFEADPCLNPCLRESLFLCGLDSWVFTEAAPVIG